MSTRAPLPIVRRRGPHWPTEEKIQLLELLKSRRALINPRLGESLSKKDKLEGWKEVTDILNRHHPTTGGRCLAEVKKQWQNLFLKAKRERRELLNNGSKSDADLTSAQFTALSVKVFETVGDEFQLRDDDTSMDVDAGDSILGPSSCLESDAPYLSESHHPEVILLPRTPDPSEMSSQLTDDSEFKYGGTMSNGDSSQPFDDHVFDGENHVGSSKHSTTNGNLPAPLMRIKKEPEDPPPEPKLDYWAEPGGSEEERSTASWGRPPPRADRLHGRPSQWDHVHGFDHKDVRRRAEGGERGGVPQAPRAQDENVGAEGEDGVLRDKKEEAPTTVRGRRRCGVTAFSRSLVKSML
ncbi:hypothetical protein MRX96_036080 [Rhipicephalus microplus]